jgi:CHAT domain-containing protein
VLLGPAFPKLQGKRLLISADGILHFVPFAMLPIPADGASETAQGPPLVTTNEIVYLPSVSTVALVRGEWDQPRSWPKVAAILADPVFEADDPRIALTSRLTPAKKSKPSVAAGDLTRAVRNVGLTKAGIPRLLDARREAKAIADVLPEARLALDFDASRVTATSSDIEQYRIVHFATHAILDNDHPELSGIILSLFDADGRPQDGFLRLHDIYNLNMPADLVVLSACSTALGKAVTGEGMVGLVRGFMYAGSRRVLASLWNVDDEATSELMRRFYSHLFQEDLSPSAALRAAQRDMRTDKRWSHPRYWAAFVVQGEWRPPGGESKTKPGSY